MAVPRWPARQHWRLAAAPLLAAAAGALLASQGGFTAQPGSSRRPAVPARQQGLAGGSAAAAAGRSRATALRSDPVNNVSPEMSAAGKLYAQRYEDLFLSGQRLWNKMKKAGMADKKIYFIGTNGNSAHEVAESVCDSLAYIPAQDGTYFIHRKPSANHPKIQYTLWQTDKKVAEKSKISPIDLFMEDEQRYRDLEAEVLQEFDALDTSGYPAACVVGEAAHRRPESVEIMKKGVVIWLDADPEYTWARTQYRPKQGGGLYVPPDFQQRPPVWAIANGWDGDIDDTEGKMEYVKTVSAHRKQYEEIGKVRLRVDIPGIAENSYWGAERIVKALNEYMGFTGQEEGSVEEEVMEKDLERFLEGARLSKYLQPALKWCEEQGAATIEDVVENIPEIAEALDLKPLERKRLEKAAASVATS